MTKWLILCLIPFSVWAKMEQVEILEPLTFGQEIHLHGDLEKIVPPEYKAKAKGVQLLGSAKTKTLEDGEKITTVVWYGLEKPKRFGDRELVTLSEPGLTTIRIKKQVNQIPTHQKLPVDKLQQAALIKALENLLGGQELVKGKTKVAVDSVPMSNARRVASRLQIENAKQSIDPTSSGETHHADRGNSAEGTLFEQASGEYDPQQVERFQSNKPQEDPLHPKKGKTNQNKSGSNQSVDSTASQRGTKQEGSHRNQRGKISKYKQGKQSKKNHASNQNESLGIGVVNPARSRGSNANGRSRTGNRGSLSNLSHDSSTNDRSLSSDNGNLDNPSLSSIGEGVSSEIVDLVNGGRGELENTALVNTESPSLSYEENLNAPLLEDTTGEDIEALDLEQAVVTDNPLNSEEILDEAEETRVRLVTEGCEPIVDSIHHRVTITNRRVEYYQNGQIKSEDPAPQGCTPSLEVYPLEKDYLFNDNQGDVTENLNKKEGYDQYQYYWIDGEGLRHNHQGIQTDTDEAHPFIEETGSCELDIDLIGKRAYRQVETVFYDRFNQRHVVNTCHRVRNQSPITIEETRQGCDFLHDFERQKSWVQTRKTLQYNGATLEVEGCKRQGPALDHEFDSAVCGRVMNTINQQLTALAKRKIHAPEGEVYITQCEPLSQSQLRATTDGCEGDLFEHDFNHGYSYVKKKYYHLVRSRPQYLTGCVRSDERIPHQSPVVEGYTHDDRLKQSLPKTAIVIEYEGVIHTIDAAKIRSDVIPVPYELVETENAPNGEVSYQGCFKLTHTSQKKHYQRADATTYVETLSGGDPIRSSVNECETIEKIKAKITGTESVLNGLYGGIDSRPVWQLDKVTFRKYPGTERLEAIARTSFQRAARYEPYGSQGGVNISISVYCPQRGYQCWERYLCGEIDPVDGGYWCRSGGKYG